MRIRILAALFATLAISTSARALEWRSIARTSPRPPPMAYHALAYHEATGETVLAGLLNATWKWNGTRWLEDRSTYPTPLYWEWRMVEEPSRNQLMLFGGYVCSIDCGTGDDTRVYDNTGWATANRMGPKPEPRYGFGMAHDPGSARTVLFGGTADTGGYYRDTWSWDGTAWAPVTTSTAPEARASTAMAFDEERNVAVLFGGRGSGPDLGDTWIFDGDWMKVSDAGPTPRKNFALVWDAARKKIILFGGDTNDGGYRLLADTWEWDGTSWTDVTEPGGPSARTMTAMAYDRARNTIVLFGGHDTAGQLDDVWEAPFIGTQASALVVISGTPQTSTVARGASDPLVVEVREMSGAVVPGARVTFTADARGGSVSSGASMGTTIGVNADQNGRASANATCADRVGEYRVSATLAGGSSSPVEFILHCNEGPAAYLVLEVPGTAVVGTPIDATVRVFDAHDNVATRFTGRVDFNLSPSDPQAMLPILQNFVNRACVLTIPNAIIFATAGTYDVIVSEPSRTLVNDQQTVVVAPPPAPPPPPPPENQPPELTVSTELLTVDEGEHLSITITARDEGRVEIRRVAVPEGATFSGGGGQRVVQTFFGWTPDTGQSGEYLIRFLAEDEEGLTAQREVKIFVRGSYYACTAARERSSGGFGLWLLVGALVLIRARRSFALLLGAMLLVPAPATAQELFEDIRTERDERMQRETKRAVAYLGLSAPDTMAQPLVQAVSEYIATQLAETDVYEVVSKSDVRAMVQYQNEKETLGAEVDPKFLAGLGNKLGASRVLRGELALVGTEYVLNLSLLDVGEVRVLARAAGRVEVGPENSPEPLLDAVRPVLLELLIHDPEVSVANRAKELRSAGWDRPRRYYLDAVLRGDGDVIGKGFGFGAQVLLGATWYGGALTLVFANPDKPRPIGIRLEGRLHPLELGPLRPYFAAGLTAFVPELALRASLGVELRIGWFLALVEAAFEHYPSPADVRLPDAFLLAFGAGLSF